MGIVDEDIVARAGRHRHRRRDHEVHPAPPVGPAVGGPVPVPRREDAVVQRQPGARPLPLLGLPGARRRDHVRPGGRSTSTSSARSSSWPAGPASRSATPTRTRARAASAGPGSCGRWSRRSTGTTSGCCRRPDAAVARKYLRERGLTRRGGAGVPHRVGARGVGRDGEGAQAPRRRRARHGARLPQQERPTDRCLPGTDPVPDLRRQRRCGGVRRTGDARGRGPEVQEHPGDRAVPEVEAPLRPELVEGPHRQRRPRHRLRGLHRRDRLRAGRGARRRSPRAAPPSPRST